MSHQAPPSPGSIDHDLTCIACGYNLRGLDSTARCPECNATIAASIEAAADLRTDPAAIRCIIQSLRIVLVANAAAIVLLLAAPRVPRTAGAYLFAAGTACILVAGFGWVRCIRGFAPRGRPVTPLPFVGATTVLVAVLGLMMLDGLRPAASSLADVLPPAVLIPLIFLSMATLLWGAFARVGLLIDINGMLRDRRVRAFGNHNGFIFMFFGLVIWPLGVVMYLYITGRVLLATTRAAKAAGMRA